MSLKISLFRYKNLSEPLPDDPTESPLDPIEAELVVEGISADDPESG